MPKLQKGFTMIELVMVIVILGILAAVALPRFYDLQTDAREAKADAIFGSVRSASAIAHSAALVNSQTGATGTVTMEGLTVNLANGYPTAAGIVVAANINAANDNVTVTTTGTATTIDIVGATTAANCRISYTEAATGATPSITVVKTGC